MSRKTATHEMMMQRFEVTHQTNKYMDRAAAYGPDQQSILSLERAHEAQMEISSWPGYQPTPLVSLPGLAARTGVSELLYKDESERFELKSFKALGGAYAALKLVKEHLQRKGIVAPTSKEVMSGVHADLIEGITFAAATDGNHGRSVAWAGQMFGCRSVIYLHGQVSQTREDAIAQLGAEIRRIPGGYDNSVHQCAADANANGWQLVADTSANGDDRAPMLVMQGYTVLVQEILDALEVGNQLPPTHIFVPGAVGGLAAAMVGHLWESLGSQRPRIIAVQASQADCIARSIAAGELVSVPGEVETFMACLAAAEVSPAAWPILHLGLDDVITVPDDAARQAMRVLADGVDGDQPLVSGESGCASTAGLIAAMQNSRVADALELGAESRVIVIGSEGATDVDAYLETVGRLPEQVLAARLSSVPVGL